MVTQRLAQLPHSKKVLGSNLSVWELCALCVYVWVKFMDKIANQYCTLVSFK